MRAAASLALAFACGVAAATTVAVVLGQQNAVREAAARQQRELTLSLMERVARNALRNPTLLPHQEPSAAAGPSQPASAPLAVAQAMALPAPPAAPAAAKPASAGTSQPPKAAASAKEHLRDAGRPASVTLAAAPAPLPKPVASSASVPPQPAAAPLPAARQVDMAQVLAEVPVEGVSFTKAKVAKIERAGVVLTDGRRIGIGQPFPSGEVLLAADPDNSRIVTSQRQLLLFQQAPGQH